MTTRIIFKASTVFPEAGLKGEVVIQPGEFYSGLKDSRLLIVKNDQFHIMQIWDGPEGSAVVEEIFQIENQPREPITIKNETVSGTDLGIPDIDSVTHTSNSEIR